MTQRTLIAYQTKGGVTGENASIIAGVLRGEFQHQVDLVDLKEMGMPDIAPYENVIVGTGIRIQRQYGRTKRLLRDKRLAQKRLVIFISSGEAGTDPEKATAKYEKKICGRHEHLKPVACQAFGGMYPGKAELDWREPDKVREWAHQLGEKLKYPM